MNPSPIARDYLHHGRSSSCPIIDMHGHVGPFHGAYLPSSPLPRMLRRLERCGIRRIVCSHHMALAFDTEQGNTRMQAVIDAHPTRFLGYWVLNPHYPELIEKDLSSFQSKRGFVGFKLWSDYHQVPVTSPKYDSGLEYANQHNLLVMVHTWGGSPYNAPGLFANMARRYPNATFLMGHSGYGEWETAVSIASDLPNVFLDITSVVVGIDFALTPGGSLMPYVPADSPQVNGLIEYMVERAGSKRVVFGSDLPWLSQHYHAGAVLFARITDEARHDILHRNAEQLLASHLETDS